MQQRWILNMLVELRMIVYIVLKDDELMAIIYIYIYTSSHKGVLNGG